MTVVRGCFKLEKIPERFQLDVEKVRVFDLVLADREVYSVVCDALMSCHGAFVLIKLLNEAGCLLQHQPV